jgi:hypothetical protein
VSKVMHVVLLEAMKITFVITIFIVVIVNEGTTIDNTQWFSIYLYVVQKCKRISILFCVETICISIISNNIFVLMLKCMLKFG